MGAREYDPSLGRWLSADTIVPDPANPQSFNRYAYVLNNPLKYTDPSGHFEVPMDEDGNLVEECGELCQLLEFQDFEDFAAWWRTCPETWQNILIDARWGDMVSFTWNYVDEGRPAPLTLNAIFVKDAGTGRLKFWLHDRGLGWDHGTLYGAWLGAVKDTGGRSTVGELIPHDSQRHPWYGRESGTTYAGPTGELVGFPNELWKQNFSVAKIIGWFTTPLVKWGIRGLSVAESAAPLDPTIPHWYSDRNTWDLMVYYQQQTFLSEGGFGPPPPQYWGQ